MRIALIVTARNERELLLKNLSYHYALGVTDFFVFLDRLDLKQYLQVKRHPNARVRLSSFEHVVAMGLQGEFPAHRYRTNHMVRQMAHIKIALEECRRAGIDWLLNIDADELITHDQQTSPPIGLSEALSKVPSSISAVKLAVVEVIPSRWRCSDPFVELTTFKTTSPFGEGSRALLSDYVPMGAPLARQVERGLRTEGYDPFWDLLDGGAQSPDMPPMTALKNETGIEIIDWFVGHALGKEIVRVASNVDFKNLHSTNAPERSKTRINLSVAHYNNYSYRDFIKKYSSNFATHPDYYASGWLLDPLKRLFRDGYRFRGFAALPALYRTYCLYSDKKLREIEKNFPGVVRQDSKIGEMINYSRREKVIIPPDVP